MAEKEKGKGQVVSVGTAVEKEEVAPEPVEGIAPVAEGEPVVVEPDGILNLPAINPPTTPADRENMTDVFGPFDHYREVATRFGVFGIQPGYTLRFVPDRDPDDGTMKHRAVFDPPADDDV